MSNLCDWFFENLYSNIFTLITVLLSGIISWIISAIYYNIGNRNNLKMSIIYPICNLLDKPFDNDNFEKISLLSKEYSVRYMKNKEREQLISLLNAYCKAIEKPMNYIYADAMFSFFEYILKEKNIKMNFIPIEYEGEIIGYEHPDALNYMYDELKEFFNKYNYDLWDEYEYLYGNEISIEDKIDIIFKEYGKSYYSIENINFFENLSASDVIEKSQSYRNYIKRINTLKDEKKKFLELKICKSIR